jgi:PadR family transcriptional regulator PadR
VQRITRQTVMVLLALLGAAESGEQAYGYALVKATRLSTGTIYTILARLEADRMVTSRWDDSLTEERPGRPRRRYYELTNEGAQIASELRAEWLGLRGSPLPRFA